MVAIVPKRKLIRICNSKQKPTITKMYAKVNECIELSLILPHFPINPWCRFKIKTNYYSNNALFPYLISSRFVAAATTFAQRQERERKKRDWIVCESKTQILNKLYVCCVHCREHDSNNIDCWATRHFPKMFEVCYVANPFSIKSCVVCCNRVNRDRETHSEVYQWLCGVIPNSVFRRFHQRYTRLYYVYDLCECVSEEAIEHTCRGTCQFQNQCTEYLLFLSHWKVFSLPLSRSLPLTSTLSLPLCMSVSFQIGDMSLTLCHSPIKLHRDYCDALSYLHISGFAPFFTLANIFGTAFPNTCTHMKWHRKYTKVLTRSTHQITTDINCGLTTAP